MAWDQVKTDRHRHLFQQQTCQLSQWMSECLDIMYIYIHTYHILYTYTHTHPCVCTCMYTINYQDACMHYPPTYWHEVQLHIGALLLVSTTQSESSTLNSQPQQQAQGTFAFSRSSTMMGGCRQQLGPFARTSLTLFGVVGLRTAADVVDIGAFIIRTGFWGFLIMSIVYYTPNPYSNY